MELLLYTHFIHVYIFVNQPLHIDQLEAQVGQKSLTWIRLVMICYIVPWWLSDQTAFSI